MELIDEVSKFRKNIKHESVSFSVAELIAMYNASPREVNIQPDFQRLFRWNRKQQSLFIESLLLEIPISPIFFYENQDGSWELIDGLQRLSTIIQFVSPTERAYLRLFKDQKRMKRTGTTMKK